VQLFESNFSSLTNSCAASNCRSMTRSGNFGPTGTAQAPSCAAAGVVAPSSAATVTTATLSVRVLVAIVRLSLPPLLGFIAEHELVGAGVPRLDSNLHDGIRVGAADQILVVVEVEAED